jgi:sugar lactone lactonase YvrE
MRIVLWLLGAALLVVGAVVALSPIEPVTWKPAPNPGLTGEFEVNDRLAGVERVLEGIGVGPEAVACDPDGRMYTGFNDGRIVVFDDRGDHRVLADTKGRPLGMKVDSAGRLIVADAERGLLSVTPNGDVEVLADSVAGERMRFVDDLDIAADGTIWFSDASTRHGYHDSLLDFLEGRPTGRLLSYDPATGETRVHLDGLFFANGVALGPDGQFVLVNETGTGLIHRLWLAGPKAGERDLFHAGLPGTPDNVTFNGRDTFWVTMPSLRAGLDMMADKPLLRRAVALLPREVRAANSGSYSFVVGLGPDGRVTANLQDSGIGFSNITSAVECGDELYLGSITMPSLARYRLGGP